MKIIYIGEFDFTRLNASTRRMLNVSKAIVKDSSNQVKIFGYGNQKQIEVEGFQIINADWGHSKFTKIRNYIFRGKHFVKLLEVESEVDLVIYYGSSSLILLSLMDFCRNRKIKLVVDIVEWYDYPNLPLGRFGPIAMSTHYAMTHLIKKADGIIAISSFLYNYYKKFNNNVIEIPVIVDQYDYTVLPERMLHFDKSKKHIIYAGTPGKKDLIFLMITALSKFDFNGTQLVFHILGPSKEDLEKLIPFEQIGKGIICHGRIEQQLVASYIQASDFTVLIRPNKRFAQAGFSTKFVESFMNATPVIANLTGDIGKYLIDKSNGFVVEDLSEFSFNKVLKAVVDMDRKDLESMKNNAKKTGESNFLLNSYSDKLQEFLKNL